MQAQNPNYKQVVENIFQQANFIQELGIELVDIDVGSCQSQLVLQPKHLQHNEFVHAGVQATIADHTAGAASATLIAEDEMILTVEFKINLLRPAKGQQLRCQATVLKPGRMLSITESEVWAIDGEKSSLVSKATITLAVLSRSQ